MNLLAAAQKRLDEYDWLLDCAKKTGVTVTFRGDVMEVIHGAFHDELVAATARIAQLEADEQAANAARYVALRDFIVANGIPVLSARLLSADEIDAQTDQMRKEQA